MGWPMWGTLIGLLDGATPMLGLMDQPFTRERFWSARDAAYMRTADGGDRRIATRPCARSRTRSCRPRTPTFSTAGRNRTASRRLKSQVRMTRYGGDCYGYCLLAAGFVDLVVEAGLKPYDIVALIPHHRAGGRAHHDLGRQTGNAGGRIVAAGDPRVHEQAMAISGPLAAAQATLTSTPR